MSSTSKRIIIVIRSKSSSPINYGRRMYAIARRYTGEAVEGDKNECVVELTGLRTFLKMSYLAIAEKIVEDITREVGIACTYRSTTVKVFEYKKALSKKSKSITTYNEINKLFKGRTYTPSQDRISCSLSYTRRKIKLSVPFIGKVS